MMKMYLYLTCVGSDITSHIGQNSLDSVLKRVIFFYITYTSSEKKRKILSHKKAHTVKSKYSSYLAAQTHLDSS